jgi:hypothetical protein
MILSPSDRRMKLNSQPVSQRVLLALEGPIVCACDGETKWTAESSTLCKDVLILDVSANSGKLCINLELWPNLKLTAAKKFGWWVPTTKQSTWFCFRKSIPMTRIVRVLSEFFKCTSSFRSYLQLSVLIRSLSQIQHSSQRFYHSAWYGWDPNRTVNVSHSW